MSVQRRWLLAGMLLLSSVLTYFLHDAVYTQIVVPLAYVFWLVRYYYTAIPQLFLWVTALILLFIVTASSFVPEGRSGRRKGQTSRPVAGRIETLAVWFVRARRGNYFKWQLANRLGGIARSLEEISGQRGAASRAEQPVADYLDAGSNHSFVDYPNTRRWFQKPVPTPLDLDPGQAVDYLESQMEMSRGRRP